MGEHEQGSQDTQPSGLLLNGLLPKESHSVVRVLDSDRWSKAEDRVAELIACIQPNQPSEERRNAVADYVQRMIMKCFPCQVFTFGSVPLKTYLPDGDIDVTAFSKSQTLKDTWGIQVRDILQSEEKNENAEFRVKEVQYIQAEVKIVKCLVENIVVDISFNQLGGLCTLCFLEEVDNLINQNHLFKRSIILIKAWCYYESRILGAHHGLISTYALETLVLYIFHVFNNTFTGPLEVLYRFLEFFSSFDWDNFCVSLWGPVPISSLPDVTAEPPRKDSGELLLSKLFLDACSSVYAVFPGDQENQGHPFLSKHFNVIDPLRVNNNLGRSVSKGNFYRIRSAFAFGAKRLARLLDCPKENIVFELNQFFMNTWERHGSGIRPDAPNNDFLSVKQTNQVDKLNNQDNAKSSDYTNNNPSNKEIKIEVQSTRTLTSQRASYPLENNSKSNDAKNSRISEQDGKAGSTCSVHIDRNQRNMKNNHVVNEVRGKYLFSRTRSSPELTDAYYDVSSRTRHTEKMDTNRRKNIASENVSTQSTVSSTDGFSGRHIASHHILDVANDSNSISNSYVDDSSGSISEDHASVVRAHGMQQEDQDHVNLLSSLSVHKFGGHVPMPFNLGSNYLPLPMNQSMLTSMGYAQRSVGGVAPANIPLMDPGWAANFQFHQGLMSSPLSQYFPGIRLSTNSEDSIEQGEENFGSESSFKPQSKVNKEHQPISRNDFVENFEHPEHLVNEVYTNDRVLSARFSSESSRDESSTRVSEGVREKLGRKTVASDTVTPNINGKDRNIYEHSTAEFDEVSRDWNTRSYFESTQSSGSDSVKSIAPIVVGHTSSQRVGDNSGSGVAPFTFYPTGPPVPFVTMLPMNYFPNEGGTSDPSSNSVFGEEGNDNNNDSVKNIDISEGHATSDVPNTYNTMKRITADASEEPKSDILNSDFASHWQNLQYGRFCQGPRFPGPVIFPPSVVPPMYMQGHFPWDGPGRPNNNILSQLMNYGPHIVPVAAPVQPMSSRPATVYQHYTDEMPRYRNGTGTYFPNPKVSARDRHSSGTRRNNYNYDRSDLGDREGNWNAAKARRNNNRSQVEKSRIDRLASNESRASYQGQNGHLQPSSSQSSSMNLAYGMYPLAGVNPVGLTSNGPSVVMLYPYDHNSGYVLPAEQLEFGSLGPMSANDASETIDGTRLRRAYEGHRFHGSSGQQSSDQFPHFQSRRI